MKERKIKIEDKMFVIPYKSKVRALLIETPSKYSLIFKSQDFKEVFGK